jgi:hypothetical protein
VLRAGARFEAVISIETTGRLGIGFHSSIRAEPCCKGHRSVLRVGTCICRNALPTFALGIKVHRPDRPGFIRDDFSRYRSLADRKVTFSGTTSTSRDYVDIGSREISDHRCDSTRRRVRRRVLENHPTSEPVDRSILKFRPGKRSAAEQVAKDLRPNAQLVEEPISGADIWLMLGRS